jgi:hypothetical protein
MNIRFASSARAVGKAFESGDMRKLRRLYPESAELLAEALTLLQGARCLNDMKNFTFLRPHPVDRGKNTMYSLSLNGRKRVLIRTTDKDGILTNDLDYSSEDGIVVEVSEHYGD